MKHLVGCEHEFKLDTPAGAVDFRGIIRRRGLYLSHLDPGDPEARRLPSGAALTADGPEAEVASPPLECAPGFTRRVAVHVSSERSRLSELLPSAVRLSGYSTHLSVGPPRYINQRLALHYAHTFAPALMLLMDAPSSPGLLVRSRPYRLELGGEYVQGVQLRAALAFAVGSVLACAAAIRKSRGEPPKLALNLVPDDHRYGWYVDRRAFGEDLYARGRETRLPLARRGTITAQEQLEASWEVAREALARIASPDDLDPADRMVSGDIPLPTEDPDYQEDGPPVDVPEERNVFGRILEPRTRPGFDLAPVMVTWDVCVFVIANPERSRRAFYCVPRDYLEPFVEQLDSGRLDRTIGDHLGRPPNGRLLHRHNQTFRPGLYDELGPRWKLLPKEYGPNYKRWRRLLIARRLRPRGRRGVAA